MSREALAPISSFLIAREGKFEPSDPLVKHLSRLTKIDFDGNIHISKKQSKTDMIIIMPGDLVISGINVAKGAVAVYDGAEPIAATIHYSSYQFNAQKIDIEYFQRYIKSEDFTNAVKEQVRGGIKTEIKAKTFLQIKIPLLPLYTQCEIAKKLRENENELNELYTQITNQADILSRIRQSILQEAIEGRLTASWRAVHPNRKGDPDRDGAALLEKIKAEKKKLSSEGKIKKNKPVAHITPGDEPFVLPEGWVWCRLGEIIINPPQNGYSPKPSNTITSTKSLRLGATTKGYFDSTEVKFIDEVIPKDSKYWVKPGDILIQRSNSPELVGVSAIYMGNADEFIYPDLMMKIHPVNDDMCIPLALQLSSPYVRNYFRTNASGVQKSMPKINQTIVQNLLCPLPPLSEQAAIVERVESLLVMVDELEKVNAVKKELSAKLLREVRREAFEDNK